MYVTKLKRAKEVHMTVDNFYNFNMKLHFDDSNMNINDRRRSPEI
jgi:hypothetical protein